MKSTNELRRGNLVKVDGKIYQVFSLDSCFVGLSKIGKDELLFDVDVKNVEPVELTDEILTKWCGFERLKHEDSVLRLGGEENLGGFELFGRDGFGYKLAEYNDSAGYFGAWSEITSLHQLQNLHHSHTEQELEIKL